MSTTSDAVMSVRVPTEMKKKLQEIAKEQRRTIGSIMREIIENLINEYDMKGHLEK